MPNSEAAGFVALAASAGKRRPRSAVLVQAVMGVRGQEHGSLSLVPYITATTDARK